jgi:hypothetical protein
VLVDCKIGEWNRKRKNAEGNSRKEEDRVWSD